MLAETIFDFDWADPDGADLEHVVGAAGVPVIAVGILPVLVAGADPVALDHVFSFLVLVPIAGANRVAADEKVSDFALRHRIVFFVNDAGVTSGNDLAAGAG